MKWSELLELFAAAVRRFAGLCGCVLVCGQSHLVVDLSVGARTEGDINNEVK